MRKTIPALLALFLLSVPGFADTDKVVRVVDGDTVILEKIGRAQLIGVDTPETVHPQQPVEFFGKEASEFTLRHLKAKTVRVEFDWQRKDKYDRTLVYLFLEDGTFFNAELVKQGYAHAYTQFPFKYLDEFRQFEREAREYNSGLWGAEAAPTTEQTVFITHTGQKYHRDGCRYLIRSKIPISLADAGAAYGTCSVCRPPSPQRVESQPETEKQEVTIYVTRTGSKYHRAECRYVPRSMIPMALDSAKRRYGPCSVCRPPT